MSVQTMGLRQAVYTAIRSQGGSLLRDPRRFLGFVTDLIDVESPAARVLYVCCNDQFLEPYSRAIAQRSAEALRGASVRAADYITDEYVIDPKVARAVCQAIAAGCADALGIPIVPQGSGAGAGPQPTGQTPVRGADVTATVTVDSQAARDGTRSRVDFTDPATHGLGFSVINIPSGTRDGDVIRVVSAGGAGSGGGQNGDLLVTVHVRNASASEQTRGPKGSPTDISKATAAIVAPQAYTGSPLKPKPYLTMGGKALVEGTDYRLEYRDNIGSPTKTQQASIIVTGKGRFRGVRTLTFDIRPQASSPAAGANDIPPQASSAAATSKKGATFKRTLKAFIGSSLILGGLQVLGCVSLGVQPEAMAIAGTVELVGSITFVAFMIDLMKRDD